MIHWRVSLFALSAPFALPFKPFPSSPYCFTRFLLFACHVFVCLSSRHCDSMWKEFCFHHSDIAARSAWEGNLKYETKVRRTSPLAWKWNVVCHENPLSLPRPAVHLGAIDVTAGFYGVVVFDCFTAHCLLAICCSVWMWYIQSSVITIQAAVA